MATIESILKQIKKAESHLERISISGDKLAIKATEDRIHELYGDIAYIEEDLQRAEEEAEAAALAAAAARPKAFYTYGGEWLVA